MMKTAQLVLASCCFVAVAACSSGGGVTPTLSPVPQSSVSAGTSPTTATSTTTASSNGPSSGLPVITAAVGGQSSVDADNGFGIYVPDDATPGTNYHPASCEVVNDSRNIPLLKEPRRVTGWNQDPGSSQPFLLAAVVTRAEVVKFSGKLINGATHYILNIKCGNEQFSNMPNIYSGPASP